METKDITVVIATFKSENKIYTCLDSLPKTTRILVIENSNNHEFKEKINRKYSNVECTLLGENKGYSIANNTGLQKVITKYALVLNPDTKLEKDTLKNFIKTAENFPDFWLIGPGNQDNNLINSKYKEISEVENIKGFGMFFNIKKFNQNFFDENYFLYFEETDLLLRSKRRNFKSYLIPALKIRHHRASSVKKNIDTNFLRAWHYMWSMFYFYKKNYTYMFAFKKVSKFIFKDSIMLLYYLCLMDKNNFKLRFYRLYGAISSMIGLKSFLRL